MLFSWFYKQIRKTLVDWLTNRALKIPDTKLKELSAKYSVPVDVLTKVSGALADELMLALDKKAGIVK